MYLFQSGPNMPQRESVTGGKADLKSKAKILLILIQILYRDFTYTKIVQRFYLYKDCTVDIERIF